MKKIILFLFICLLTAVVSACVQKDRVDVSKEPMHEEAKDKEVVKDDGIQSNGNEQSESGNEVPERSLEKELEIDIEGEKTVKVGKLHESDLRYAMYVLEGFEIHSEEPNKDVLFSTDDEEFFVRIEKLDEAVQMDEVKKTITDHFENAVDLDPSELSYTEFHDAKLYMLVEHGELSSAEGKTTVLHIVKDVGAQPYKFTVFIPLKESVEGIMPHIWSMLINMEG